MTPICRTKECTNFSAPINERGLCLKCFSTAKKLVESGAITWEKLEELGLVLPKLDPFSAALKKATGLS